jgi:exonuclease VII large subunit
LSSVQAFLGMSLVTRQPERDNSLSTPPDLASDAKSFMRRVLQGTDLRPSQPDLPPLPKRNYELAFRLLEDAAKALSSMQERQEQLEASVASMQARASLRIEAAEETVREWQAFAVMLKTRLQDAEERLAAMQERAQAAEAQASIDRARALAAEKWQNDEGAISRSLHDKIVATFGSGSRVQSIVSAAMAEVLPPRIDYE